MTDWQLWIDFHRKDADGLTHGNLRNATVASKLVVGEYVVVGNEEADPAVAEVVQLGPEGLVLVRVLPGPAAEHLDLVGRPNATAGG
jgi:hypothetical protein